jgi:hypothetical protein
MNPKQPKKKVKSAYEVDLIESIEEIAKSDDGRHRWNIDDQIEALRGEELNDLLNQNRVLRVKAANAALKKRMKELDMEDSEAPPESASPTRN